MEKLFFGQAVGVIDHLPTLRREIARHQAFARSRWPDQYRAMPWPTRAVPQGGKGNRVRRSHNQAIVGTIRIEFVKGQRNLFHVSVFGPGEGRSKLFETTRLQCSGKRGWIALKADAHHRSSAKRKAGS